MTMQRTNTLDIIEQLDNVALEAEIAKLTRKVATAAHAGIRQQLQQRLTEAKTLKAMRVAVARRTTQA